MRCGMRCGMGTGRMMVMRVAARRGFKLRGLFDLIGRFTKMMIICPLLFSKVLIQGKCMCVPRESFMIRCLV